MSITGWTLRAADGTPNISLSGTIPAPGYYLLERIDDISVPGVTADDTCTGALSDDGEDLLLRDAASNLIDQVNGNVGWFAGHAVGRVPMARADTTLDGSVPGAWTYNPRCGSANGVTVRVVGDDDAAANEYQVGYQALTTVGITIVTDTSASQIQHNKFMVFDVQAVWAGSTNFTDTCLTLNANNSLVITDTVLANIYTTEFNEMWGGAFHTAKSDNTSPLLDYNGATVKSFFSPTDLVAFEVWDELAHADETIHFGMFFWTDPVLTQRTTQRLAASVQVFGVWDQLGAGNVSSADVPLCLAGAQIKVENFAGKVHHKFAVIDVNGSNPTVILGSYNWTDSGAYDNDENTLIIHDAALAQAYYAEWERMWSAPNSIGRVSSAKNFCRQW